MNARPSWSFLGVKNANKNCWLDKLSQSFSDILLDKKLSKSIAKIAPDIKKYLRNVFTIQAIQDIAKF